MARSVHEIAVDLKQAATAMVESNIVTVRLMTNGEHPLPGVIPEHVIRLPDGRSVELTALADELLEAIG